MKLMGIDASHRNTGVVVLELIPATAVIQRICVAQTLSTKKVTGVLAEYEQVDQVIKEINSIKFQHGGIESACEIAYSGRSFASSRNVGISWGISMGTRSIAYLPKDVKKMFGAIDGDGAKEKALAWLLSKNFHLSAVLMAMTDHEIDAICVAIKHNLVKSKI